jgi:hypothetical protein
MMDKDKFHIGQKVRLIKSVTCPELIGSIFIIVEQRKIRRNPDIAYEWFGYRVDYIKDNNYFAPREDALEPIYDGDEKSSWSECAWKPKELTKNDSTKAIKTEKV